MPLQVICVGVGRTGTDSLHVALERLLDGPCYHGNGAFPPHFPREEHARVWHAAVAGTLPDWDRLFDGYVSAMDWNVAAFWRELSGHFLNASFVLSVRPAEDWWMSYRRTVAPLLFGGEPLSGWLAMCADLLRARFTPTPLDQDAVIAAYEKHNDEVMRSLADRPLLVWSPGDGWEPLCSFLRVEVPDEPFPHRNSASDFRRRSGLDT